MKLLVITSCTGEKSRDTPKRLVLADFQDAARLQRRQKELAEFACKATGLYVGDQHVYVKQGIQYIRKRFGANAVTLKIISAGYGLLSEDDFVVPYEVTFNDMAMRQIDAWSSRLKIPTTVRTAVERYPLVIVLLGDRYLRSIAVPVIPSHGQRLIFLTSSSNANALRSYGATAVLAGVPETRKYGSGLVGLKGKMFALFARGLVNEGAEAWPSLLQDTSPKTFLGFVAKGLTSL